MIYSDNDLIIEVRNLLHKRAVELSKSPTVSIENLGRVVLAIWLLTTTADTVE